MTGARSSSAPDPGRPDDPAPAVGSGLTARTAAITMSAQALARVLSTVAGVLSLAVVARVLDVATYADWATIMSLVIITGVVIDPGLSPVIVRRLAQDPAGTPTARALVPLRLVLGAIAFAVVVGVALALRGAGVALLAVALAAQLFGRSFVLNALPWLQSDHRLHRLSVLEAGGAATGLALLVAASAADAPATVLALVGLTLPPLVLAVLAAYEIQRTPSSRIPPPGAMRPRIISVLHEVAPLAGALILTAVMTRVHTAFVNIAEGDAIVARYLFAFTFIEQVIVLAGVVAGVLLPMLAARARQGSLFADTALRDLALSVAALGALGSGLLVALATPLSRLIGGDNLAASDVYLEALSPMVVILLLAFLLSYAHLAMGMGARYLRINLVALGVTLAGNAAFTLTVGADATARVAWITELTVVVMAFAPAWREATWARGTAARLGLLIGLTVVAAELSAREIVPPVLAGGLLIVAVLAVEGRRLLSLVAQVRAG